MNVHRKHPLDPLGVFALVPELSRTPAPEILEDKCDGVLKRNA
jgi:hypothetical protein